MEDSPNSENENIQFDLEKNQTLLRGKKILIVEDSLVQQKIYKRMLEKYSADVHLVDDGEQAIELILEEGLNFNAIIMDYFMPGKNGLETAKALRVGGCSCPIIGMTSSYDKVNKYKWFVAGCDAFLDKPIQSEVFLKHISYHFALNNCENII